MMRNERAYYRIGYMTAMKQCREDLHAIAEKLDREIVEVASILSDVRAEHSWMQRIEGAAAERRPDGYILH